MLLFTSVQESLECLLCCVSVRSSLWLEELMIPFLQTTIYLLSSSEVHQQCGAYEVF